VAEDALAVSQETGKALLICINMDGEIASEHYAGVRYKQPEITKLYEPYVCVIASVYRHTPRDHDEEGRRILCPRFGSVTCGEHIAIEPILYEKFMDGERVAPRHIMVELGGEDEVYDVYYADDTASVFDAIRKGITEREAQPTTVVRGDRSIVERVASRDIQDREAVEDAYREGDPDLRRSLLEAAKEQGGEVPLDLLRLAVFGLDVDMGKLARAALAQTEAPEATDLISDALRVPMDDTERDALISALGRLGETSQKARWLAVVHKGLAARSKAVDSGAWAKATREYEESALARRLGELEVRRSDKARAHRENPKDPSVAIELAEASLVLARKARLTRDHDIRLAKLLARTMLTDAERMARRAEKLKAPAWRVNSVLSLVAYYRGEKAEAYAHAEAAVGEIPAGEPGWNTMAVLTIFGEGRFMAIKKAAKAGERWPSKWLTDLDAAYSALLNHPLATESQVLWHHDLMLWLGVKERAIRVLRAGLRRFPNSPVIHKSYRAVLLEARGVYALEAAYEAMLREDSPPVNLEWFAGYASKMAAEHIRRWRRPAKALAAYERSIAHFERAVEANPASRRSADIHVALALAAKARLAYEAGDDDRAVSEIVASFERMPDAAGTRDGLGLTPASTAQMLMARLVELKKEDLVAKLETAMGKLDPALLVPKEE
jgi:tetratricopeptide (TPR) repeat protein